MPKPPAPPEGHEGVLRDVSARGVRTRVLEAGREGAHAVVMVHGFLTSHRAFEDAIEPLSTRYRVIAPDLPGFGESEKPSPARYPYGIEAYAEAVADVIAAFDVGRATVVGHSMGGAIALTLAAEHPELVQRLVLVDTLCYPFPMSFRAKVPLWPVIGGVIFKQLYGRTWFRRHFRETLYGPTFTDPPSERIDWHYERFNGPSARESAHAVMRAVLDTRAVVARVTRIQAPALVVWGREDRVFPATHAGRLARELPRGKLVMLEAGHSPHEEKPRELAAMIAEFIEGRR